MGFSLVFQERVSETLGNTEVLFPFVSVPVPCSRKDIPPPLTSFLSLIRNSKTKSPAKKIILFSTSFQGQGHKGMEDYDVQPVHEAARIVEQHPAHCVYVCVCVCVCVCVTLTFYMIFLCVHTVIQGGQGILKVSDE